MYIHNVYNINVDVIFMLHTLISYNLIVNYISIKPRKTNFPVTYLTWIYNS